MFDDVGWVSEVLVDPNGRMQRDIYPLALPALHDLKSFKLHKEVTFLIGENGSGKSTLVEAIAGAWGLNPEGGSRHFSFATRESHSNLAYYLTLVKSVTRPHDSFFLRAESFFNVASEIERRDKEPFGGPPIIDSYGGKSLHEQSHGESFFALLMNRLNGSGLYIFDEPEAALSPTRQMAMLARMHQLIAEDSQFIIATHSPILMAYPGALIYELSERGFNRAEYTETEHYIVTKSFLSNPERMLSILFEEENSRSDE